jgi:chromosome segregation ATPase
MDSLQRLSQSIAQVISLVGTLRRENEELLEELRRVSQEKEEALRSARDQAASEGSEGEALRSKAKDLEGRLKTAEEHVTQYALDLEQTRDIFSKEKKVLQAEIQGLKESAAPGNSELDDLRQDKDELEAELGCLKAAHEALENDHKVLLDRVREDPDEARRRQKLMEQLKKERGQVRLKLEEIRADLESLRLV